MLASEAMERRFGTFVEGLVEVIGHADREKPLRDYCLGLLMPSERKSVEPMAAVTAPARVSAQHQTLLHFVGEGRWSDEKVLAKVRALVQPSIERHGRIDAWIVDDTGFPKKGAHSVGVARQYCGQLGKQDNCQVAVSLSLASRHGSLPIAYRLYLPKEWAGDRRRRIKAGIPKDVKFRTKPEIALEQIRAAHAAGLPRGVVLMDAGYGADAKLRAGVSELDLAYVAGIQSTASVWAPGVEPLPPKPRGIGRPSTRGRLDDEHRPTQVKKLALGLPASAWKTVAWREGSAETLASRFVRLRVRPALRGKNAAGPEEWLLVEWPKGAPEPTKYWLSTLPHDIVFAAFVNLAKLRWRIERDYLELKQEVGLGHYEGRGWRGFHHHATLCIAAYAFLISEREAIPPSEPPSSRDFPAPVLPEGHRPRGAAAATGAPRAELDRNGATAPDRRPREKPAAMSLLRSSSDQQRLQWPLVTQ